MKKPIVYTDEPLVFGAIVEDFLPSPEELREQMDGVKVTIALSRRSVEFFKREAAKHDTQYQRMIRRLLDAYAALHEKSVGEPKRKRYTAKPKKRAAK
jgi:hypothetical protein